MIICSFKNCLNYKGKDPNIHFFCFPRNDHDRCLEWIRRSGDKSLIDILPPVCAKRRRRVCSLHFPESAFKNASKESLNTNAIPYFYNEEIKAKEISLRNVTVAEMGVEGKMNSAFQHFEINCENNSYSIINAESKMPKENSEYCDFNLEQRMQLRRDLYKMKFRLEHLKNKYHQLEKVFKCKEVQYRRMKQVIPKKMLLSGMQKYVSGAPSVFVKMQFKGANRVKWLPPEKELASTFYDSSPLLYEKMLQMGFKLPVINIVKEWKGSQDELCDIKDVIDVKKEIEEF